MFRTLGWMALSGFVILGFVYPAHALDWRSGKVISVNTGETLDDDLYVAAQTVSVDGTVNGDVIAFAQTISINGTINGDFFAAAQYIVVLGTVTGSIRTAGNTIYLGDKARVGRDLIAASESLELKKGSTIGKDLAYAGAEALLEGNIGRNAKIAAAGLEVGGTIGGNLKAEVAERDENPKKHMHFDFMGSNRIEPPPVAMGITIEKDAKIKGNLDYHQSKDLTFPPGTILGKVTRIEPSYAATPHRSITHWLVNFVQTTIALLLMGLLLLLLLPRFVMGCSARFRANPWHTFLWGAIAFASFIASVILLTIVSVMLALLFGVITLKTLSAAMIFAGILGNLTLILGFVFVAVFLAKIVVGVALGEWILRQGKSPLAEHRFWPLLIGVPLLTIVLAVVSMPMIPGVFGGILRFIVLLLGLGAVWLKIREHMRRD